MGEDVIARAAPAAKPARRLRPQNYGGRCGELGARSLDVDGPSHSGAMLRAEVPVGTGKRE